MQELGLQTNNVINRLNRMSAELDGAPVPQQDLERVARTLGPIGLGISKTQLYGSLNSLEMFGMIQRRSWPQGAYLPLAQEVNQ